MNREVVCEYAKPHKRKGPPTLGPRVPPNFSLGPARARSIKTAEAEKNSSPTPRGGDLISEIGPREANKT